MEFTSFSNMLKISNLNDVQVLSFHQYIIYARIDGALYEL